MANKYLDYTGLQSVVSKLKQYTDDVEIGGRNLLLRSDFSTFISYYLRNGQLQWSIEGQKLTLTGDGEFYINYSKYPNPPFRPIPAGTELTLSCYVYENTTDGHRYIYYEHLPQWACVNIPANFTGLFKKTIKTTHEITDLIVDYDNRNSTTGKLVIGPVKLEFGNKATDWTPAPEDYGNAKIFSGTCSTAAATTAKEVTCPSFTATDLVEGAIIFVNFDNTNSGAVASITLNVNSTGAKPIKQILNTSVSALTSAGQIIANQTYMFVYDGTNWVTKLNYNSTYSSKPAAYGGTAVSLVTTGEKYTWNNKGNGTITGITMNGSSKGTSGVVNLGTVITAHQDISGKADKSATVSTVTWNSTNQKLTKTINGTASDVVTSDTLRTAINDFYQASPSASTSCSAGTLTQVKLVSTSAVTNGSGFSISSNGIKITTAGKYRISAGYSVSGMAAGISKASFTIRKGSAFSGSSIVHQLTITTPGNSASWTSVFSISSKIVALAANDILFLGVNFTGGAGTVAGSTDTYLLIERVA